LLWAYITLPKSRLNRWWRRSLACFSRGIAKP
jgi:hypothetical protein